MESLLFAIGLTTFALGGAMSLFAWRVVRQNRRREAARVELLSALAFPDGARVDELDGDEFRGDHPLASSSLFVEPETSGASSRRTIALAAICLVMTVIVGATVSVAPPPATAADHDPRVELLALEHSVTADAFLVTGRFRNPIEGTPLHDVVAVVTIVDPTGRSVMTVRAPVTRASLNPGESSDFSAAAAKATNVGGYRVRFDARERESIPQIDRRRTGSSSRSE